MQGLRDVAGAGAELILLNSVFDEAEQMERLVAEVVVLRQNVVGLSDSLESIRDPRPRR